MVQLPSRRPIPDFEGVLHLGGERAEASETAADWRTRSKPWGSGTVGNRGNQGVQWMFHVKRAGRPTIAATTLQVGIVPRRASSKRKQRAGTSRPAPPTSAGRDESSSGYPRTHPLRLITSLSQLNGPGEFRPPGSVRTVEQVRLRHTFQRAARAMRGSSSRRPSGSPRPDTQL